MIGFTSEQAEAFFTGDQLLRAFVEEGDHGVICPRLQEFSLWGKCDFSLETLRVFLEGKHGDISPPNVTQWTKVAIDISDIYPAERRRQISDLVSQKKAAGLDVHVYSSSY